MTMGLRGRDEHRQLMFGDLVIVQGPRGEELLFNERLSKTRSVSGRKTPPKYFCSCESDPQYCLIELVKKMTCKRPPSTRNADHCYYLTIVPTQHLAKNLYWYREVALGKNKIGAFMPEACALAGITRHTNHGVRRTAIKRMRKSGIPDDKIIKITGHRSVNTLAVYDDDLEIEEHQNIQNKITRTHVNESITTPPIKSTESIFGGATFNSCTINVHMGATYMAQKSVDNSIVNATE